jgi:hypothetical protein
MYDKISILPKPQSAVELLSPVDIGNGQHNNFKLHVHDLSTPRRHFGDSP